MRAYFKTAQAPLTPVDLAHLAARIAHGEKIERSDPARRHRLIARLGTDTCDEICRRYEQGESTISLAKSYDASKPAILTLLRSRGITVRSITITPVQLERAIDLYEAGKSVAQVGVELGFSASGIWRALKANGVQMRARGF